MFIIYRKYKEAIDRIYKYEKKYQDSLIDRKIFIDKSDIEAHEKLKMSEYNSVLAEIAFN